MSIKIDIESEHVEQRTKKGGGIYHVQEGFAHTVDRHGQPNRYPEKFTVFPQRDNAGNPVPYKPGTYFLSPNSIRINNGFLELAFPTLMPIGEAKEVGLPHSVNAVGKK